MKNRKVRRHYQAARIYQHHYQPSANPLNWFRTLLAIIFHGSPAASATNYRRKR